MENLKREYEEVLLQINENNNAIEKLKENPEVKRFIALCEKNARLNGKKEKIYEEIRKEEYRNCHHIWVYPKNFFEGHSPMCVKCGLDLDILNNGGEYLLSPEQKAMRNFLKETKELVYYCGLDPVIAFDTDMAKEIYKSIIEENPDISDEEAAKMLEEVIENIEQNKTGVLCLQKTKESNG